MVLDCFRKGNCRERLYEGLCDLSRWLLVEATAHSQDLASEFLHFPFFCFFSSFTFFTFGFRF